MNPSPEFVASHLQELTGYAAGERLQWCRGRGSDRWLDFGELSPDLLNQDFEWRLAPKEEKVVSESPTHDAVCRVCKPRDLKKG